MARKRTPHKLAGHTLEIFTDRSGKKIVGFNGSFYSTGEEGNYSIMGFSRPDQFVRMGCPVFTLEDVLETERRRRRRAARLGLARKAGRENRG